MARVKANTKVVWQPTDFIERFDKYKYHLYHPIADVMKQGMRITSQVASRKMKSDTGRSSASIRGSGSMTLNRMYGATGFLVGSRDIGVNIAEFGRTPQSKMPPVKSIASWARVSNEEAYLIARKIGRTGINEYQPVLKAKQSVFERINTMVMSAMEEVLRGLGLK